jgi:hypothetical protein
MKKEAGQDLFDYIELFYSRRRRPPGVALQEPGAASCSLATGVKAGGLMKTLVSEKHNQARINFYLVSIFYRFSLYLAFPPSSHQTLPRF